MQGGDQRAEYSQELQHLQMREGSLWDGGESRVHHRPMGAKKRFNNVSHVKSDNAYLVHGILDTCSLYSLFPCLFVFLCSVTAYKGRCVLPKCLRIFLSGSSRSLSVIQQNAD